MDRDEPTVLGQLHAINADGSKQKLLGSPFGIDEVGRGQVQSPRAVFLADTLPDDRENVLISAMPLISEPYIRIEKLDIYTRRRDIVATAPVRRADFTVDRAGAVRFAHGADADNTMRLYYRDNDEAEWRLVNDEASSGHREYPLGFSADGSVAYLQVEQARGPDVIMAWRPADGRYTEVLRDPAVDPYRILYDMDGRTPVGASFMSDRVRNRFFDENSPVARLYRTLEKSFTDEAIALTSTTADGRLALVYVWSDRNNGDYFLLDLAKRTADRVFATREWFQPDSLAGTRAISFKTRDGIAINGFLTAPKNAAAGPAPMVLLPHGGPFGIFDIQFDDETQMLAEAGYAVLRVNYRGSGNYGRAHVQAGAREWGGRMQDDLTDATRWAIEQGIG